MSAILIIMYNIKSNNKCYPIISATRQWQWLPARQFVVSKSKLTMNKFAGFILEWMKVIMIQITNCLALHKPQTSSMSAGNANAKNWN